jgi:hypothetical protein
MRIVDLGARAKKGCPFWSHPATDGSWIVAECKDETTRKYCTFWKEDVRQCVFQNTLTVARNTQDFLLHQKKLNLHREGSGDFPKIVCLCGSCRFKDAFIAALERETDEGKIVLSVGRYMPEEEQKLTPELKAKLDELHLRKIDLCDEVLILNVGGYIGESTGNELAYAKAHGKTIRYLEPDKAPK